MSHDRPQRRSDLLERDLGDETLLYDAVGQNIHVLNVTGQVIWRLCDGMHAAADMIDVLQAEFNIDETVNIDEDVTSTLEMLRQKDLIV